MNDQNMSLAKELIESVVRQSKLQLINYFCRKKRRLEWSSTSGNLIDEIRKVDSTERSGAEALIMVLRREVDSIDNKLCHLGRKIKSVNRKLDYMINFFQPEDFNSESSEDIHIFLAGLDSYHDDDKLYYETETRNTNFKNRSEFHQLIIKIKKRLRRARTVCSHRMNLLQRNKIFIKNIKTKLEINMTAD